MCGVCRQGGCCHDQPLRVVDRDAHITHMHAQVCVCEREVGALGATHTHATLSLCGRLSWRRKRRRTRGAVRAVSQSVRRCLRMYVYVYCEDESRTFAAR